MTVLLKKYNGINIFQAYSTVDKEATQKKNRNKFDLCSVNDTAESEYSYFTSDIHATLKLHSSDDRL